MIDAACQGFDRAVEGSSAFVMDALALDSIFLVGDTDCCLGAIWLLRDSA